MVNLFIFDGTALIYRAFYALPEMSNSKGIPTNAVFGVAKMLSKFLREHVNKGDSVIFVLDSKEKTFRHSLFDDYKANRKPTPDEMVKQIPYVEKFIKALNIPLLKGTGYEADDVIATLVKRLSQKFDRIYVVTGDKDLLQLVEEKTRVLRFTSTGVTDLKEYDERAVVEKYGLTPSQIGDYLALVGDKADNIPGVRGIGDKGAVKLLKTYGSLSEIYSHLDEIQKRYSNLLKNGRENALLSKKLVELSYNVPLEFNLRSYTKPNKKELIALFDELEFSSLKKEFGLYEDVEARQNTYKIISSLEELEKVLKKAAEVGKVAFDTETTSLSAIDAKLVGISISWGNESYYTPVGHERGKNLPIEGVIEKIKIFFSTTDAKVIGQNLKYDLSVLKKYNVEFKPYFDTMIAAYLLNPNERKFSLDSLAMKYLNYKTITYEDIAGKNGDFSRVNVEKAGKYSAEDSDVTYRLYKILSKGLYDYDLFEVFKKIEMPLVEVLSTMELNGVYVDTPSLKEISDRYSQKLFNLEEKIYALAGGMPFNINSPKQVSEILFQRLGLRPRKRTKSHAFSTNAKVLEDMINDHPIIPLLLEYRKYFKLKSTYLDALPKMVNPRTSRVHTSFNQTGTSTGRLSSSEPNLQNIPARNEEGREIRKAIKAQKPGWIILSADYSQIELRVLAHVSEDPALIEAFKNGIDIHTATAAKVFGVKEEEVTKEMRQVGKMVNFAVTYGVSPYGLAKRIGMSNTDAQMLIENYFKNYSKVKEYLDKTMNFAKENGYVKTIFGRRRDIPSVRSKNHNIAEEGKRMAINAPIQGSAADIIKIAMINIHEKLKEFQAMMILQVHDELVFELPQKELESVRSIVKEEMENVVKLKVPLTVDIEFGETW
ncbi:DNA polymerase I [Mesoaciditoga sp.]